MTRMAGLQSLSVVLFFAVRSAHGLQGPTLSPRIIGGHAVQIESYPWQVSVTIGITHWCGGSVIADSWVLSAAHCLTADPQSLGIRPGKTQREGGQITGVMDYLVHHMFTHETMDYDVGVLQLKHKLNYGPTVKPVNLANTELSQGTVVTVTGWGTTSSTGKPAEFLQAVQVTVFNWHSCKYCLREEPVLTHRMFCAGEPEGGKDSCSGDDGGPVTLEDTQYGITSWGIGCGIARKPGVYTSVPVVRDWIAKSIGGEHHFP